MNVDELKQFASDLSRCDVAECDLLLYGSAPVRDDAPGVECTSDIFRYCEPDGPGMIPLAILRVTGPAGRGEFHWSAEDPDNLSYRCCLPFPDGHDDWPSEEFEITGGGAA